MDTALSQASLWVALTMAAIAAVTDLRTGLIPNRVVSIGAAAGVMVQLLAVVFGEAALGETLQRMGLGFLLCALVPLALYVMNALGGGDLKLFVAIGLCAGPAVGLDIQLWAHLLAVAFLPLYYLCRGDARAMLRNTGRMLTNRLLPAAKQKPVEPTELTTFRFAPAIFAATVWVCLLAEARP